MRYIYLALGVASLIICIVSVGGISYMAAALSGMFLQAGFTRNIETKVLGALPQPKNYINFVIGFGSLILAILFPPPLSQVFFFLEGIFIYLWTYTVIGGK